MTEQQKAEAAEAEAKAKADAEKAEADFQASLEGLSDEEKAERITEKEAKNIDWEKVAQDEREKRERAEKVLAEKRFKAKKVKDEDEEEEEEDDEEDKPLTAKQLQQILAEERQNTQKELLAGILTEKARKLADSDQEARAIVEIHRSRIFPSYLSIDEQIEEAHAIANKSRLIAQNSELKRALLSKETRQKGGAENSYRDAPKAGEPKLTPQDKIELARQGFSWDGKFFSKKLTSGKTLYRDWESKKSWVK